MKEERLYIEKFKEDFSDKFGYKPIVTLKLRGDNEVERSNLNTLNTLISSFSDEPISSLGVSSRKRNLVMLRSIFCMLAADQGHTYKSIGHIINRDHSTAIYNVKNGYDLLETDADFQNLYIKISSQVNPKIYPHARINETSLEEQPNSKSTSSFGMSSRKYTVTRPNPRISKGARLSKSKSVRN